MENFWCLHTAKKQRKMVHHDPHPDHLHQEISGRTVAWFDPHMTVLTTHTPWKPFRSKSFCLSNEPENNTKLNTSFSARLHPCHLLLFCQSNKFTYISLCWGLSEVVTFSKIQKEQFLVIVPRVVVSLLPFTSVLCQWLSILNVNRKLAVFRRKHDLQHLVWVSEWRYLAKLFYFCVLRDFSVVNWIYNLFFASHLHHTCTHYQGHKLNHTQWGCLCLYSSTPPDLSWHAFPFWFVCRPGAPEHHLAGCFCWIHLLPNQWRSWRGTSHSYRCHHCFTLNKQHQRHLLWRLFWIKPLWALEPGEK